MKQILYSVFFLLLMLLTGCTKCKRCDVSNVYEPLDPSVQTFFDNMRQGDTLVFQDQFGNYDTAFYGAKTETWGCEECTYYDDRGRTECCGKKFKKITTLPINFLKPSKGLYKINGFQSTCSSFEGIKDVNSSLYINLNKIFNSDTLYFLYKNQKRLAYIRSIDGYRDSSWILSREYNVLFYVARDETGQIKERWTRVK